VCPIFRNVGGHSYGTVYGGPIGSVITPHLRGLQDWKHLSSASSLCGACSQACPVKIDLAHHLLQNRRNAVTEKPPFFEGLLWSGFSFVMQRPGMYRLGAKIGGALQPLHDYVKGSALDPVRGWTDSRETPQVAKQTFTEWWKENRQ
jgi:L-lactate dehydrogenase complex protein LldF